MKPRLAVAGDLTLTDGVLAGLRREGARRWFGALSESLLKDTKGLVCNLEAAAADGVVPAPGKVILTSGRDSLAALPELRLAAATLANNHMLDWGWEAAKETAAGLRLLGIPSTGLSGAGPGAEPVKLDLDGWTIGLLAYADASTGAILGGEGHPGVNPFEPARAAEEVALLAREVDAVLVSLHAGFEQIPYPEPGLMKAARHLAKSGAALVFGHHSHCLRGIERQGTCEIAYGLGNFVTPSHRAVKDGREVFIPRFRDNRVGAVLIVEPARPGCIRLQEVRFVWTGEAGRTRRLSPATTRRWRRRLQRLGEVLGRSDYDEFQARETARLLRNYQLKLGVARALRRRPRGSQLRTALRLLFRRGEP